MNTAAIANHLNVAEAAITEVQEWARVLWVRVRGLGARFVSKKVIAEMKNGFELKSESDGIKVWEKGSQGVIEYPGQSFFAVNRKPEGGWQAVNGWESESSFEDAVALLDGTGYSPVVIPAGYAVTSTGEVVLQEDWDEIEGAM